MSSPSGILSRRSGKTGLLPSLLKVIHCPNVGGGRLHGQMDLASLASTENAVLAGMSLAFALDLDARAVDEQVQQALRFPVLCQLYASLFQQRTLVHPKP